MTKMNAIVKCKDIQLIENVRINDSLQLLLLLLAWQTAKITVLIYVFKDKYWI